MSGRKRKRQNTGFPRPKKPKLEGDNKEKKPKLLFTSVKTTLKSICRPEHWEKLRDETFNRCVEASKIVVLGSYVMLFCVNEEADNIIYSDYDIADYDFFTNTNGRKFIQNCFNAVTIDNINEPLKSQMPQYFKGLVEDVHPDFEWPSRKRIARIMQHHTDLYETNVKNNLFYHAWRRVNYFLRAFCYEYEQETQFKFDETDKNNAKWNLFLNEDRTGCDERRERMEILVNTVLSMCGPSFVANNRLTLYDYIDNDWFESIIFFIRIQRYISDFKQKYQPLVTQWNMYQKNKRVLLKPPQPRPPKVENFTVIPLNGFKLHSSKIDHEEPD